MNSSGDNVYDDLLHQHEKKEKIEQTIFPKKGNMFSELLNPPIVTVLITIIIVSINPLRDLIVDNLLLF